MLLVLFDGYVTEPQLGERFAVRIVWVLPAI